MTTDANSTLQDLRREGAVLAVRMPAGKDLMGACRAALRGGIRVLEITLTTPSALEAIAVLSREPGIIAGAGTVLTADDARAVARAGGRFALSPVFDAGAGSATEILAAHRNGAPIVKVFPSGALGGPEFLRAVRGPFPAIPLLPTSGPTAANLAGYFQAGAAAVGIGGPEFFPPGWTLDSVEQAARRVRAALDARPAA